MKKLGPFDMALYSVELTAFVGDTEAILHVRRTHQYCLHVTYDCGRIPESVLPVLLSFNRANKLIRELMDKAPPLVVSLELLVRDEKELRRDVLAANLDMEGLHLFYRCSCIHDTM